METTGVDKHAIHAGQICAPMGGGKCPNFRIVQTEFSLNQYMFNYIILNGKVESKGVYLQ